MLSKALGLYHSDHCKGIHLNMAETAPSLFKPWQWLTLANALLPFADQFPVFASATEISWLKDSKHWAKEESGAS